MYPDNLRTLLNKDRLPNIIAAVAGGLAVGVFVLFVYGYPRVFVDIEASEVDHFERNAAAALAEGDVDRALKIALWAIDNKPLSPLSDPVVHKSLARTVYARALLAKGDNAAALEQLREVLGTRESVRVDGGSRSLVYFAPARLTLGKYLFEQGDMVGAISNFELARARAVLGDESYGEFWPVLYRAYASAGLWSRALEFGEPSDTELDALDGAALTQLGRICEGAQDWPLAGRVGERLLARDGFSAEAHYALGRAALAEERDEVAAGHLKEAAAGGREGAAFFLGRVLSASGDQAGAIEAFMKSQPGDLYRAFALASAMGAGPTSPEAVSGIDGVIEEMRARPEPVLFDRTPRLKLLAFRSLTTDGPGRFPLLALWEDSQAIAGGAPFVLSDEPDGGVMLRRNNFVLKLQWVENLVQWGSVERAASDATVLAGWIDTARDWYGLRSGPAFNVASDSDGNRVLNLDKMTWFYSAPVRSDDGAGYLMAGRVKNAEGRAHLGLLGLDESERVVFDKTLGPEGHGEDWSLVSGYARSQVLCDTIVVSLDRERGGGAAEFDDVMLVALNEPPR